MASPQHNNGIAKNNVRLASRRAVRTADDIPESRGEFLLSMTVVPAEAGTQDSFWIPASAGMTGRGPDQSDKNFGI